MDSEDFERILNLALSEGWVSDLKELSLILRSNPKGCFTAEVDNETVGAIMSVKYKQSAWIGNLIVDENHRKKGIGTRLMEHMIELLDSDNSIRTIYLNAAHEAISLYKRFGFKRVG